MAAIIQTEAGRVHGSSENGLSVYRGIPYAAPPVGELRFRVARPHPGWDDVLDCEAFRPIAPQVPNEALDSMLGQAAQEQSEDCLFLNVWTPATDDAARPVMVWIHGGAFTIGSGSDVLYDGATLAARGDVVVVTINYRLGALGFLHLPALEESNFGMRDQVAALRWVRDNIASFGGDPGNITIFGESAGGMSVASLMGSPEAQGLFHKAIPQSGAGHHGIEDVQAVDHGQQFCELLGVEPGDADALQSASVADILAAQAKLEEKMLYVAMEAGKQPEMPFRPIVDGEFLTEMPINAVRAGQADSVAALIGCLDEESKLFAAMVPTEPPNEEDAIAVMDGLHGDGRRLYDIYRAAREARGELATPYEIQTAASGDELFRVPAMRLLEAQSQHNDQTWCYLFDWKSPMLDGALGSCHALDIPFVFGTHQVASAFAGEGVAANGLAELTMDTWLAFARTGNPSTSNLPWPAWDSETRQTVVLGESARVEDDFRAEEIAAWDGVL